MELRQLRYFVAVATELNFSRAAERMHISQPPLSQQIKQLEEELGVQLLMRTSRTVELTEAGRLFLTEACETLERAKRAMDTARRAAAGDIGTVSIATLSTADVVVFPRVIPACMRRYPGVQLSFSSMSEVDMAAAIEEGRIDVGFATVPVILRGDCVAETIHRERAVAALPVTHRLAARAAIALEELSDDDWVLPDPRRTPSSHYLVVSMCSSKGFTPRAIQHCDNMQFMLSLIAAGIAVAVLPERVRQMPRDRVVVVPVRDSEPSVELGVIYSPRRMTKVVRSFIELAHEVFRKPVS